MSLFRDAGYHENTKTVPHHVLAQAKHIAGDLYVSNMTVDGLGGSSSMLPSFMTSTAALITVGSDGLFSPFENNPSLPFRLASFVCCIIM